MRRGRRPYPDLLTPREQEVLALLREGLTNEQIGVRLGISESGARYHVSEILSKLGVNSRQDAARIQRGDGHTRASGLAALGELFNRRSMNMAMKASNVVTIATAMMLLGVLALGVVVMSSRSLGKSRVDLDCVEGEAAQNRKAQDGDEMETWRIFETVEEAESFLCVEIPHAREPGTWYVSSIVATRSHSLCNLKSGSWVAGDKGYKSAHLDYRNEQLGAFPVNLGLLIFPADLEERGGDPARCEQPLRGTRLHAMIQGELVEFGLARGIEGEPFIIGCWERDGLSYFVASEFSNEVDPARDILPLLESIP